MDVTDYIAELIAHTVIGSKSPEDYRFFDDVYSTLQKLQPNKPNDGTVGFLAFSTGPDKPRMKIKTGRFLCKKLKLNAGYLSEGRIQNLTTAINTRLFPAVEFRLCSGAEITKNYENHVGGSSCMTGHDCRKTKLYENNPDRYQQLIVTQINDTARAMVVKLDNGKYFMDRIYTDSEHLITIMRDYARENGWYYRSSTGAADFDIGFDGKDVEDCSIFKVSGLDYKDGEVPFADTLSCYNIEYGKLDIFHMQINGRFEGTLDFTSGYFEDPYICFHCGENAGEDYTNINDEIVCEDCRDNLYGWCEDCNEHVPNDDIRYVESVEQHICDYCLRENYHQCSDCGDWFENCTSVNDEYVCETCLENYQYCDECGTYYATSNGEVSLHIEDLDVYVCEDCAEHYQACDCGLIYENKSNCECELCKK